MFFSVLAWSGFNPKDQLTWFLEVAPALAGIVALALTRATFPLTPLAYVLILVHSMILMVGGHWTYAEVLRRPGVFESVQREHKVTLAGPTTLSAILNALQMGFRTLAIEKRSSEVWQILGAVQTEFRKYNAVVDRLGKQLNTASNSVDTLGQRARAMNRTLKMVEALPEGTSEAALLGFDGDEDSFEEEGAQAAQAVVGGGHSDIVLPEV
jgi:hypothetical protein